ncbi:adenosylcobinamide-phosphate synthase CbiB [Leptolyngbya sp. CCNP1308]|uniref:adenosylcobinamide-phosphate synthase CbiB n=1 Tax=Leptolyngbya sp. CCNP1308 TaxID=3110255 RepID=UPI002B21356D|nr:adenosylcobinamide-phosphate synthase CbiB [Leptolyngbya sp. CCNP1308]MEA5452093.1 adenosylcobinamide-phosphate synthase CbiB [Leptolyngbya sp. CCNP1308]
MMSALWFNHAIALVLAAALDRIVGDPWGWPHPVQAIGQVITWGSQSIFRLKLSSLGERSLGVLLGLGIILGSGLVGWGMVRLAGMVHPAVGLGCEVVLLASCFAGRSLRRAAEDVLAPLESGNIPLARQRLALYVGRDTENLDEPEILRAVLETVSENATDGVLAPLFYALVGAFLPWGSVPMALAYKAASTLDSMIGYRESPYTHLGWFSARFEDGLTWLPCRLTVATIALLSGNPRRVWAICRRDAPADPSPNAGWSECAYAAALGVQLGGQNIYRGQVKEKPLLGDAVGEIGGDRIDQALTLTRHAFLLWIVVGVSAMVAVMRWTSSLVP